MNEYRLKQILQKEIAPEVAAKNFDNKDEKRYFIVECLVTRHNIIEISEELSAAIIEMSYLTFNELYRLLCKDMLRLKFDSLDQKRRHIASVIADNTKDLDDILVDILLTGFEKRERTNLVPYYAVNSVYRKMKKQGENKDTLSNNLSTLYELCDGFNCAGHFELMATRLEPKYKKGQTVYRRSMIYIKYYNTLINQSEDIKDILGLPDRYRTSFQVIGPRKLLIGLLQYEYSISRDKPKLDSLKKYGVSKEAARKIINELI